MAQAGTLVVLGDAGEAWAIRIYEAQSVCARPGREPRRGLRRKADAADSIAPSWLHGCERPGSPAGRRRANFAATARPGGSIISTSTTPGRIDGRTPPRHARSARVARPSIRATLAEIRRAAATGIYDIRGGGAKRQLPHFDDLLFLGASISRYPLEGYRERCGTDVVLGDAATPSSRSPENPDHHRRHELRRRCRRRPRRRWAAARRSPAPPPPPATAA